MMKFVFKLASRGLRGQRATPTPGARGRSLGGHFAVAGVVLSLAAFAGLGFMALRTGSTTRDAGSLDRLFATTQPQGPSPTPTPAPSPATGPIAGEAAAAVQRPETRRGEPVPGSANRTDTAASPVRAFPGNLSALTGREVGPRPIRLTVGSVGIDAPIVPVGADPATGALVVPYSITEVGWYEAGVRPGQEGSAVLTAHVDLATEGRGVFFKLREVEPGDTLTIEFDNGGSFEFEVIARKSYARDALPSDLLFARGGPPVVALVTCGGEFDWNTRQYSDNVVVFGVLSE